MLENLTNMRVTNFLIVQINFLHLLRLDLNSIWNFSGVTCIKSSIFKNGLVLSDC